MYLSQPLKNGHVRNFHVFTSVIICKLFTFPSSSPKHVGTLELNLTMLFIKWLGSTLQIRIVYCWPKIQHGLLANNVFWYPNNLLRKQMGIFDYYLVEIFIGLSSISFQFLEPIEKQDGRNHSSKHSIFWKSE